MKMTSSRVLRCLAILMTIIYLSSVSIPAVLAEGQMISTEERIYSVGDVIAFSGAGLEPGAEYLLQIYHGDLLVQSIEFNATSEGSPPASLSWNSSSSEPGTYTVKLLDSEGSVVAESTFGLVEINKLEFMPNDLVIVVGGGAEPYGKVTITIVTDSNIVFNVSVTADENGEFNATIQLPFNITTGDYSVEVYIVSKAAPDIMFQVFVNATVSNMINVTASELEELISLVSGMNVSINQSLLAKLKNALKKLEQAETHLLSNQTHVAWNMLKAAKNILKALLHEIQAQGGKHLDDENAAYLNSSVQEIIGKIEVTESSLELLAKGMKGHNDAAREEPKSGKGHCENIGDHENHGKANGKKEGHINHGGKPNAKIDNLEK